MEFKDGSYVSVVVAAISMQIPHWNLQSDFLLWATFCERGEIFTKEFSFASLPRSIPQWTPGKRGSALFFGGLLGFMHVSLKNPVRDTFSFMFTFFSEWFIGVVKPHVNLQKALGATYWKEWVWQKV